MRLPLTVALVAGSLLASLPSAARAAESVTGAIPITVQFSHRTSLKVSKELLEFDVTTPDLPAVAEVEFSAAARAPRGAEVVLSVEAMRAIDGPGGAADVETSVTFAGDGEGTRSGTLDGNARNVAARWQGSGVRRGRVVFALRSAVRGTYRVPVSFVLSTP